ncbi:MAG: chemotaxis response regulator protein-glutamate methylesterase [Proteobacteria bacterium]|nr:chemotaxis response regulator protein-glutamate methylesterase [Pseudomonadota bacterium]
MSFGLNSAPKPADDASGNGKIRVLIVDDSLVIRGVIARLLKAVPEVDVVGTVSDGAKAIARVKEGGVDIVVLDIEMPVMDGITALPRLLEADRKVRIIMASTLTTRNADISIKALKLGASDYIPKPSSSELIGAADFKEELIRKIFALGAKRLRLMQAATASEQNAPLRLRAMGAIRPKILTVASSTGGPKALHGFLGALPRHLEIPVLITQHMPPTFTGLLADHLMRDINRPVFEARDGDPVAPGTILLAPGDFHMRVVPNAGKPVVRLDKEAKENYCRPAADPMLRSVVAHYGAATLAVVLTGMGSDGLEGCRRVTGAGGTVIAQDEASSVVWGMPGAVARAGLCSRIAPVEELAAVCAELIGRTQP